MKGRLILDLEAPEFKNFKIDSGMELIFLSKALEAYWKGLKITAITGEVINEN